MHAPPALTIRPTRPQDEEAVIGIFNLLNNDLPPMSVDAYREWTANRPEGAGLERFVADLHGTVVGSYDLREATWVRRSNTWIVFLEVDAPHRNAGIGSQLHDHMLATATRAGAARLYGSVREDLPASLAFVERRGCRRTGRVDRMSRLDVHGANLSLFAGVDERVRASGIEIMTLEQIGADNDRVLRRLHAMETDAVRDIPSSEDAAPDPYDEWVERVLRSEGRSPRWFWVAIDGVRPVGVARLSLRGARAAMNGLTAVDAAYRGRGIARALKVRTIQWARENGVDYLYTGNDAENLPMLAINTQLGYQPLPGRLEVMKEVAGERRSPDSEG